MNSFSMLAGVTLVALRLSLLSLQAEAETKEPFYFNDLSGQERQQAFEEAADKHFAIWKEARGKTRSAEAELARFYALRAEKPDMVNQVIADGKLQETEIKARGTSETVNVEMIYEVPKEEGSYGWPRPVWRRITPSHFEVWTPHEGCLFDRLGRKLATAHPSRDNSTGRQWFGAFLPDGRWLTTELHDRDDRVYIFNREGVCVREIKVATFTKSKPKSDDGFNDCALIVPWARSDKRGQAWVMRLGSEGGMGEGLLEPDGSWRWLKPSENAWQQCMPRQLGVRLAGGVSLYFTKSDDSEYGMMSRQPSHGPGVGEPSFEVVGKGGGSLGNFNSDGLDFGFWPGSHACYLFGGFTWFFDSHRRYAGWINGIRVGDASDQRAMLFRMENNAIATVSPDLKAKSFQRFVRSDGRVLEPLNLQPDIGIGVFGLRPITAGADENGGDDFYGLAWIGVGRWKPESVRRR